MSGVLPPRLRRFVEVNDAGCWEWTGAITKNGYAAGGYRGPERHRQVYTALVGPIPDGMQLDHVCHTNDATCKGGPTCPHRRCVNPAHLEPVTSAENKRRGIRATKTHCIRGHEFTPENTYARRMSSRGVRQCRKCNHIAVDGYKARQRAAKSESQLSA